MSCCPVNCSFPYHSVIPPTHCPYCGRCLGCGVAPWPRPVPPCRPRGPYVGDPMPWEAPKITSRTDSWTHTGPALEVRF